MQTKKPKRKLVWVKQERKWRWVTCQKDYRGLLVWIHSGAKKPSLGPYGFFVGPHSVAICHNEFFLATGVLLKDGDCLKVEFNAKVLE